MSVCKHKKNFRAINIYIEQRITDGEVDDDEVQVTNSRHLETPYRDSGRHEVIFDRNHQTKVAVLQLKFGGGNVNLI